MQDLEGRVAVVTGGASGIGRAVAEGFAAAGMRIVLADIEQGALNKAAEQLSSAGHEVLAVRTDVSDGASVQALADAAVAHFGAVNVVHNNAGVGAGGPIWTQTERDWQWVLGVNLWGVIHGIRVFVPLMLEQGEPAHIVNTGSMAGLISVPYMASYNVSKHGVVTLSETLYRDLRAAGANIGVSVLCPGMVQTNIFESERNRPAQLTDESGPVGLASMLTMEDGGIGVEEAIGSFGTFLAPEEVAAQVVDAVRTDRFYILTHPEATRTLVQMRCDDILEGRPPSQMGANAAVGP